MSGREGDTMAMAVRSVSRIALAVGAIWIVGTVALPAGSPTAAHAQGTAMAGGAGGKTFVRMCPPGEMMVGFAGRLEPAVRRPRRLARRGGR